MDDIINNYCSSFNFCRGCVFNGDCIAPIPNDLFLVWYNEQCAKIKKHIEDTGWTMKP